MIIQIKRCTKCRKNTFWHKLDPKTMTKCPKLTKINCHIDTNRPITRLSEIFPGMRGLCDLPDRGFISESLCRHSVDQTKYAVFGLDTRNIFATMDKES